MSELHQAEWDVSGVTYVVARCRRCGWSYRFGSWPEWRACRTWARVQHDAADAAAVEADGSPEAEALARRSER